MLAVFLFQIGRKTSSFKLSTAYFVLGIVELVAISNTTTVDAGETTVLICVGYGQPNVDITWSRDGQIISNSSLLSIYEEDLAQGGRVFKQSFLQLCSVQTSDSGNYSCTISNGMTSLSSDVTLSVGMSCVLCF